MAYIQILGIDVLLFLLTFFIFTRLSKFVSFSTACFDGLEVVLAPDERTIQNIEEKMTAKPKRKPKKKRQVQSKKDDTLAIKPSILVISSKYPFLKFFPDYEQLELLISIFILGVVLFFVSNGANMVLDFGRQVGTSLFLFGIAGLALLSTYYEVAASSITEKSFCFLIWFFSFFISLFFIAGLHPSVLDFRFAYGINDLRNNAINFMNVVSPSAGPNKQSLPQIYSFLWMYAAILSFIGSVIAAMFALPAFNYAKYHVSLVKNPGEDDRGNQLPYNASFVTRVLLHAVFFAPLFIFVSWIPALSSDLVIKEGLEPCSETAFTRDCLGENYTMNADDPWLYESTFVTFRYIMLFAALFFRFCVIRPLLSSHLDSGLAVASFMGSRGKDFSLTAIKSVLDQTARRTCKIAIQLLSPVIFWTCLCFLLERWGGYAFGVEDLVKTQVSLPLYKTNLTQDDATTNQQLQQLVVSLFPDAKIDQLRDVTFFNTALLRASISYIIWFTSLAWFFVSCLGYWYYNTQDYKAVVAEAYHQKNAKKSKKN